MKTHVDGRAGHIPRFGEAVHHATHLLRTLLAHDAQRVLRSTPGVNHQWFAAFTRRTNMGAKALTLPRQIALQAVIVKPGFANGLHFGMLRAL